MLKWLTALGGPVGWLFKWLSAGPLDRILSSIDHKIDNETERERIRSEVVQSYMAEQVKWLSGRAWWFPLFFIAPAGFWFASVCVYSVLWCKGCAFPQDWTIAALPDPLNDWMGAIIASLFVGWGGKFALGMLRK